MKLDITHGERDQLLLLLDREIAQMRLAQYIGQHFRMEQVVLDSFQNLRNKVDDCA